VLSLETARRLLGPDCRLSDEELKLLLDQLGQVAQIALDEVALSPDPVRGRADAGEDDR